MHVYYHYSRTLLLFGKLYQNKAYFTTGFVLCIFNYGFVKYIAQSDTTFGGKKYKVACNKNLDELLSA